MCMIELIKKRVKTIYKHRWAYFFILPSFTFFVIFMLYPVFRGFELSFVRYRVPPEPSRFIGLRNYIEVFGDRNFWQAMRNTFTYTLFVAFGNLVIAMGISMIIFPLPNKQQSFFKSLYYLPGVTSAVVIAIQWRWIYHPVYGFLNYLLSLFGHEPVVWLGTIQTALPSIIFMDISKGDGAAILLILAALGGIPREIFEAAECDGARKFQIFRLITLPLLKPIILYLAVMNTIYCLQMFAPVFLLTRGGPEFSTTTVAFEIYQNAFMRMMRFDLAATQGVLLFIVTMVISIIYFRLFKDDVSY